LDRALRAARLGIFEWDARRDRFTGSEELDELCGFARRPSRLAHFLRALHPDDRRLLEAHMRATIRSGEPFAVECRLGSDRAPARWMRVRAAAPAGAEDARVVGLCEDATADKQAENERAALMRRERELRFAAERASRAKDEFLSMFSHELRSPLNAILGWNRILAVKRTDDPEVAAMTARIERSAKAQLKMVNDLLDLGRIDSGKLTIEPRPTRLSAVVAGALEASRPLAAAKGIELASRIDSTEHDVYGDPDRLQQVVWNLLSNAFKFTDAGGRVELILCTRGDLLELVVADSGQGISAELLPHIFEKFRQADNSTTRHSSGLGLGLALVREIVAMHGGSVGVESPGCGQGATFTVRLPALRAGPDWRASHDSAASHPRSHRPLAGLAILVVDDDADARAVVAETLRLEGAQVVVSDSARTALDSLCAEGAHYDVVVTDIGMPTEDGYSLIRKLRGTRFGQRVIAIALTGYASQRDRDTAMEAGFDVHVTKPVDFERLVPLIERMARSAARRAGSH
jgi:signal transduction histidine kinase/CheY-like chemotaxis protein